MIRSDGSRPASALIRSANTPAASAAGSATTRSFSLIAAKSKRSAGGQRCRSARRSSAPSTTWRGSHGSLMTETDPGLAVCVYGLWHLGCVTAACAAAAGHRVVGLDDDAAVVRKLKLGQAPLYEPELDALIVAQSTAGRLGFTADPAA